MYLTINTTVFYDIQIKLQIKDRIMARMALMCLFEKMKEAEKATRAQSNQTLEFNWNLICKIYFQ